MTSHRSVFRYGAAAFLAAVVSFAAETTPPAAPAVPLADQPPRAPRPRISPHETISVVIGERRAGARVTITYGRPFTKDPKTGEPRKIWGGLVPWEKPDRLGADEATLLLTTVALKFGETVIPAGAYTLYTVPSETGSTKLAFSSAVGQWGVPVDVTKDVARIDLTKRALETSIDQLTLGLENDPAVSGGRLKVAWEKTQFTADFTVVK